MKTKIIAFCGIDGSGKTSQLDKLSKMLSDMNYSVKTLKVEYSALKIIFRLSNKITGDPYNYHPTIPPEIVQLAVACDFAAFYTSLKTLCEYDFVLCDRHKICNFAYSKAYGIDEKWLLWIREIHNLIKDPDLIFYFDIDPVISFKRISNREGAPKSDENIDLLNKTRNAYQQELFQFNNVVTITADKEFSEITTDILTNLINYKFFD